MRLRAHSRDGIQEAGSLGGTDVRDRHHPGTHLLQGHWGDTAVMQEVHDAVENAREIGQHGVRRLHKYSAKTIRRIVCNVLQNLPDDMTVMELRDELEIKGNGFN